MMSRNNEYVNYKKLAKELKVNFFYLKSRIRDKRNE